MYWKADRRQSRRQRSGVASGARSRVLLRYYGLTEQDRPLPQNFSGKYE